MLDCSQSPFVPWDFKDSYASTKLPPSWFVMASATWGEYLNYPGFPSQYVEWGRRSKKTLPLPSVVRHHPQVALAFTNSDGGSLIKAYES